MTTSRSRFALATFATIGLVAAATAGVAAGPADAAYVHGADALVRLGDRLPAVAAQYGLNPGELQRMLREDPTLKVDRNAELAYFDVAEPADAAEADDAVASAVADDAFTLSSLPGADKTIYLDFDGHVTTGTTWNSQNNISSIVSPAYDRDGVAGFSAAERQIIADTWAVVAEDFAPWNVNVTTIDPGADALRRSGSGDTEWGVRVVITGDDWNNCGCGGFAYVGAFDDSADEPAFVFNSSFVGVSEATTHEVGHTMLLSHDGLASGTTYYQGHDTDGTPGWAPIMGASYYEPVTQWSKQEYFGANNTGQDDTAIIGSLTNGNNFGVRADDHGDTAATATQLSGQQVQAEGTIETRNDVDVFSFVTNGGGITFFVENAAVGPNLDVELTLRNSSGAIVAQDNVADGLEAGFDANVPAGTYTVEVTGVGVGSPAANPPSGYTDYGSLGRYTLHGYTGVDTPPDTEAPSAPTGLAATQAGGDVTLTWNPNTESDLAGYSVRRSNSQSGPFTALGTVGAGTTSFVDTTAPTGTSYYVVNASDTSGNASADSNVASTNVAAPDTTAPSAPTGLVATVNGSDIALTWNANAESDLAGYTVRRSSSQDGPFAVVATVGSGTTSFVDSTAPVGTSFYVVTANDSSGNTSRNSNTSQATVPEPPIDLSNTAVSDSPVAGSVSGTFGSTTARGGAAQSITEVDSGGRPSRRHDLAEHRWTIPASEGNQTLTVVASATNGSDADNGFAVEWSTNGSSWVPFATIANGQSIDVTESIGAPTGNVVVRVIDTDRSSGNTSHNTVSVDFIELRGDGDVARPPTPTATVASLTTSTQSAGQGNQYGIVAVHVTDDLGQPVVGAQVTVDLSGSFSGSLTGTTDSGGTATMQTADAVKKPTVGACVSSITGTAVPYSPGTESC